MQLLICIICDITLQKFISEVIVNKIYDDKAIEIVSAIDHDFSNNDKWGEWEHGVK
jgi:hypothetical protein